MTPRHRLALALADALLSGERDAASARLRCERALGSRARWIARLAAEMVALPLEQWRDNARNAVATAIEQSLHFAPGKRTAQRLRLRAFPVAPPRMAPLPPALFECMVPDLPTPRDLAQWLDLELAELEWLTGPLHRPLHSGEAGTHYNPRWIAKRSGGVRLLEIPKAQLRAVQRRLLSGLLEFVPPHEAAHGFRARHSCVTNARPHVGQAVVMRMDLEDFFGSIGGGKVYALFSAMGYPAAAARALTRLTTCATPDAAFAIERLREIDEAARPLGWTTRKRLAAPHLPQGAPTSPALANLCAFNFDVRVQALAEKFGVTYTRYADDLTFSGSAELARRSRTLEAHVGAIALEEGLRINHRKTRVMRASTRQNVTGIVVNHKPNSPRPRIDHIKAMLHNCLRHGAESQAPAGVAQLKHHLAGHLAHLHAVNPARSAKLRKVFDQIRWPAVMLGCLCASLSGVVPSPAQAEYPTRPIRLISPFAPGGGNDIMSRTLAAAVSPRLGQSIVVDNRPGANTIVAMEILARATPDGYTLLTSSSSQATNATLYAKLPYDSIKDFAPVSTVGVSPLIVAVNPALPIKSIGDLIAAAKAKPGAVMYPSAGTGNSTHLAGELFAVMAGVTLTHVPYKGLSPGLLDLMAGRLQTVFSTAPSAIPHIKTNRLRGLAVTSAARSNLAPQLPTVAESGLTGYEAASWYGIIAPAGTPRAVITRLNQEITSVLATNEFREQLMAAGADPLPKTPEAFAAYLKTEIAKWAKVIKLSGAKAETL